MVATGASHRRHHGPQQAQPASVNAASAGSSATGSINIGPASVSAAAAAAAAALQYRAADDPAAKKAKYHKRPGRGSSKSKTRQVLGLFAGLALSIFFVGQFVAHSSESLSLSSSSSSSSNAGATRSSANSAGASYGAAGANGKAAGTRGSAGAAAADTPDWALNLQTLPPYTAATAQSLASPQYGKAQRTGRYRFTGSPGCRRTASSSDAGSSSSATVMCVSYHPEVELSYHLDREEALDNLNGFGNMNMAQGGGGGVRVLQGNINIASQGQSQQQKQKQKQPPKNSPVMGNKIPIGTGVDDNVAVLTRHGYKGGLPGGQINQDRLVVVAPYLLTATVSTPNDFLMALFDGHGEHGEKTSELAVTTFPHLLATKIAASVPLNAARNGYDDTKLIQAATEAYHEIDSQAASISGAGATATSILRVGDRLYYINAGDSQSFLATYVKSTKQSGVEFITTEHKPHLPEEKARIERMGGQVMMPPVAPPGMKIKLSSRVLALLPNGMQLGLAMSRSIGDPEAGALGVVPTPDITILSVQSIRAQTAAKAGVDVSDVELFAVVASDGIYDHIEPDEIATTLASALYGGTEPPGAVSTGGGKWTPVRACEHLIMTASQRWLERMPDHAYRDDISIAVSKVII